MAKEKYIKPTVKLMQGGIATPICNTIISASVCVRIEDETGGTTRIDHRSSQSEGSIVWQDWPGL